jgi:[acyl-carrier-protein] S-malonyltransferase
VTIVFMFPGQSSRDPEMFERLEALDAEATSAVMGRASRALGRDLREHYRSGNAAMFETNRDVQLGVFVANHAHLVALERTGVRAQVSLGLSLGEYNHLVHAGAIAFEDAVRLVDARGAAYDAGPRGAMACVFPLPLEELHATVDRMRSHGVLEIANLNSPTQNVIAGEREAVMAACDTLEEEHGCTCVLIEDKIPMHASIFRPVAEALEPALRAARWRAPRLRYLPNVTATFEDAPTAARIVERLACHVHSPVLWRQSIELVAGMGPDTVFVEVGPRTVLHNLLSRSWKRNPRFATDGQHRGLDALGKEIARAA